MNKNKKLKQTLLNYKKICSSTPVSSRSRVTDTNDAESASIELGTRTEAFTAELGTVVTPNSSIVNTLTESSSSQPNDALELMEVDSQLSPNINKDSCNKRASSTSTADRKFNVNWLTTFPWFIEKKARAFCKYCEQSLPNNLFLLKRHNDSKYHVNVTSSLKQQTRIDELDGIVEQHLSVKHKVADLKILMFLIRNNLPFNLIDSLVDLIKSIDPDSKVCKRLKFSRTKGTDTTTKLFAEEGTKNFTKPAFFVDNR